MYTFTSASSLFAAFSVLHNGQAQSASFLNCAAVGFCFRVSFAVSPVGLQSLALIWYTAAQ